MIPGVYKIQEMTKFKKEIMQTVEIKICQIGIEKEEKNI